MKQKAWATPPHLRSRTGDIEQMKQRIAELELDLSNERQLRKSAVDAALHMRNNADKNDANARKYVRLREIGVVVMDEECKHLQGEDLDAYLNKHTWPLSEFRLSELLQQALVEKRGLMQLGPTQMYLPPSWFTSI